MIFEGEENLDFILICIGLGFSSKMSFLPTAVLSIVTLLIIHIQNIGSVFRKHKLAILLMTIGFSLQIQRNITLTGYPLYPFEGISIPVQWRMNKDEVKNLSKGISNSAKGVFGVKDLGKIEIMKKERMKQRFLLQHRRIETLYPLILAIGGLLYIVFLNRLNWGEIIFFILPALGQVGMWYFHAPDARFASFAFWWLGAGLISFTVKDLFPKILIISLPILVLLFSFSLHTIDFMGSRKDLIILKPSDYLPTVPKVFIYTTESGLELLVPENEKKCDDCPLPCTRYPRPNIRLGKPGIIESGFYLE